MLAPHREEIVKRADGSDQVYPRMRGSNPRIGILLSAGRTDTAVD